MNIIEAIEDDRLFRPYFKDLATWSAWFVLLKALFGLPMTRKDLGVYKACTGRKTPPLREMRELYCVCGRRGGKSYIAAVIAVYLALFHSYKEYLSPGERGVIQILASDRPQSQTIFRYIAAILRNTPVFSRYVARELKESIDLTNNISIEVFTASFRGIRGRTVVCGIFDEVAYWMTEGRNPDREILSAIRPAMATVPNSKLIVISSPYARFGILYEHHRDYFGQDDSEILVWQADTRTMNPLISQKLIDRERKKDPSAARSEWDAEFREDIEQFLPLEVIQAVTVPNRRELPPDPLARYSAFVDPSGGRRDAFTLAIGHRDSSTDHIIVSKLLAIRPPFDPEAATKRIADALRAYRINAVVGDRYAGVWVPSAFEKEGISYTPCDLPKSGLYLELEAVVNAQKIELLDSERLRNELSSLERRRGRSGKDAVDHPPRGSDDIANALAGLSYILRGVLISHAAFDAAPSLTGGLSYDGPVTDDECGSSPRSGAAFWDSLEAPARSTGGGDW